VFLLFAKKWVFPQLSGDPYGCPRHQAQTTDARIPASHVLSCRARRKAQGVLLLSALPRVVLCITWFFCLKIKEVVGFGWAATRALA
jgi:hypothetical protein